MTKTARRNPAARAAFFRHKEEIAGALSNGALMREVFDRFAIPCSYMQFTRYVAKHLPALRPGGEAEPTATTAPVAAAPEAYPAAPAAPLHPDREPRRAQPRRARPVYDPDNIDPSKLF